jgi:hypothetical protein
MDGWIGSGFPPNANEPIFIQSLGANFRYPDLSPLSTFVDFTVEATVLHVEDIEIEGTNYISIQFIFNGQDSGGIVYINPDLVESFGPNNNAWNYHYGPGLGASRKRRDITVIIGQYFFDKSVAGESGHIGLQIRDLL